MSCLFSAIGPTHVIPKDRLWGPFCTSKSCVCQFVPHSNHAFDITKSSPPNMFCSVSMFISATHPKPSKNASGAKEKSSQSKKIPPTKNTFRVTLLQKIILTKKSFQQLPFVSTKASYEFDTFRAPLVVPTPSSSSSSHRRVPALPASPAAARDAPALAVLEGLLPRHWELHGGGALKKWCEDHLMVGFT